MSIAETPKRPVGMHPKKFAMWLFIVSVVMIFAALTSAYIVRQAEGNWASFQLPSIMYSSTIVILLSSATMHWAYLGAKKDNMAQLKNALTLTSVLGVVFLVLQFIGWEDLVAMNVFFVGNPSGSFVYVITGLHGLHIVSGILYLFIMLYAAFKNQINSGTIVRIEMCANFWHFLGALWIYLFIFMLMNR
ncbi:cytochrome c oxidase subunit 3 [Flammeovirga kamogawensis]|uniref:Cytochrome c oxidase subunit 3 n=1 Tax=Flammeovirga kamogawensis TaxID=373891 RepID=A0ABX8GW54_9BACT|nr:cytochrome c oxidase subunit 3 [Flammeovirga kamogawensis]MBB6461265.1 cytochrome c oxidase subunit 3 [Flammeovirga kamogawensis]QWG07824.1 cytochrome c oxidase subunit 3 [Flammeovirga kamogawensis]TRX69629.1 cytochrome oxidase subunit III [Flammeovirga kamogawensis]